MLAMYYRSASTSGAGSAFVRAMTNMDSMAAAHTAGNRAVGRHVNRRLMFATHRPASPSGPWAAECQRPADVFALTGIARRVGAHDDRRRMPRVVVVGEEGP